MEKEPTEKNPEKATDRMVADLLIKHIKYPCEAEVEPGVFKDIRNFYIRLAKEQISKITDEEARKDLQATIETYEKWEKLLSE